MAKSTNIECNACGKTLLGRKGTVFVQESHIAFKGAMTVQTFDDYNQPDHFYITENPTEMHHFCDLKCLKQFIEFRHERYELHLKKQRIAEAKKSTDI